MPTAFSVMPSASSFHKTAVLLAPERRRKAVDVPRHYQRL